MTRNEDELALLQDFLDDYDNDVKITENYEFNQGDTINRIELYRASKFKSGDRDSQGNKKYFFNILNPQAGNVTKNIDLDTKDVRIISRNAKNRTKSMVASEMLYKWMKDSKFSIFLNKISETLPIYGSFVAKKVGSKIKYVPLKWIKFDPAVEDIANSPYIIEELYFQPYELRKMKSWDKEAMEELIEKHREAKNNEILVYELHCEMPNEFLGLPGEDYSKGVLYIGALGDAKRKGGNEENSKIAWKVLHRKAEKEYPYKKLNMFSVDGRALGLGLFEMLFDAQERWNEMANQKATSMKISNKKIFQTRDTNIASNILTDLLNGDILTVNSEVTPVAVEERNLAAYDREEANVEKIVRNNSAGFEIVSGESLPSRTPFRLGALLNQNAGKIFEFIREEVGIFVKEIIVDWVLPDFKKEMNREQIFQLFNADVIQEVIKGDNNRRINEAIKRYTILNGNFPSDEEVEFLRAKLEEDVTETEFVKILEGVLDFDFDVDVIVTGESYDVAQRVETTSNFIQLISQNPQIMQDPQLKKLLLSLAEDVGISPTVLSGGGKALLPSLGQIGAGATPPLGPGAGSPPLAR